MPRPLLPLTFGTTGTGLDAAIVTIGTDIGLNLRLPGSQLLGGMAAADGINTLIIQGIRATGAATDQAITASDVYAISDWIRANHLDTFIALHGNDEDGVETGYHLVQGDGAFARAYGLNAVDSVLDSLYHIGFQTLNGRFVNEDGDGNAEVDDVAFWLGDMLAADLAAGTLATIDPRVHGTTGTGLDRIIDQITADTGLNTRLSLDQINQGATAANGMNALIIGGIRATGVADDGEISALDMYEINDWIRDRHRREWTDLHGNDEGTTETGFHLIQGDGATTYLYGENLVDTLADGLYHIGFGIMWNRFVNEDGNGNATLDEAAQWLSHILANDLADGSLASGKGLTLPPTSDIDYQAGRTVQVRNNQGQLESNGAALRDAEGTFALRFNAGAPDSGTTQVLFAKDGASNRAGDITAYISNGELYVTMQNGKDTAWLKVENQPIAANQTYDLAVSFGSDGLEVYLNGVKVAVRDDFTSGMEGNTRSLIVGAGNWGRSPDNPTATWNHFYGSIEGFTYYDRALSLWEIEGLATQAPLPQPQPGTPIHTGALPASYAGTGLAVSLYDRGPMFTGITDLIAQTVTQTPTRTFTATRVDFGATNGETTLAGFLDDAAKLTSGGGTVMESVGFALTGYVWLPAGTHVITVQSDDGFQLALGGQTISAFSGGRGFEGTSRQIDFAGGLYKIDLFYYENSGDQGLRLLLDGQVLGAQHFYRSPADFEAALATYGATPPGGLPQVYDGPVGTTGTGLDQIILAIGTDEGLANNISHLDRNAGAAAADTINRLIVDAIRATGAANDGTITASETYTLSDYIRARFYATFVAAHGNDETGIETGYHLVQNDGASTLLFGENAVNTVFDGIYHIGFQTVMDRFANEDGNANARVETVAYWLNELLKADLEAGTLANPDIGRPVTTGLLGSAAAPNVVATEAMTSMLGAGALTLRLTGTAQNGIGNDLANTLTGNTLGNLLDGGAGNDTVITSDGADIAIGGRGDDALSGGADADTLIGGGGNDRLSGDAGADSLIGGAGADRFVFAAASQGRDFIADFVSGTDRLEIDASGFGGGLQAGALAGNRFVASADPQATQAFGQFLYDRDDGKLWFDSNGTAAGNIILVAVLEDAPILLASDFTLVA